MSKCCDFTSGMLRHSVELQSKTRMPNGSGGFTDSWSAYATVKGQMKPVSGSERFHAERLDATTKNRLILRYRSDIEEHHRVKFDGRLYQIRFIENVEYRNKWLVLDLDGGVPV
jgi:SPP1 family predicted phage head-tail adaptor